ncbi:TadE/TadG family type IV pilus assembly protein [Massilia terrae]|uniref:Pilus assembly protein n=1 Tax=Massilia terrae TaxID=1811224 RepID=A0ABT2CWI7_9BURK|nr:TadE/TadG family type IV pilus assembly protein [Massilia terrae]MCS0658333.1 pilus assembly protein [Massilia terrae]
MKRLTGRRSRKAQAGVAAVEFSLVAISFFFFVFATLELARAEFLLNTLREVTRRAAAAASNVSFNNATALQNVQADAVFRTSSGPLVLGDPVTAANVKIDYLSVSQGTLALNHVTALPSCPAKNHLNCVTDPYADNCIRFVRARVCASMDSSGNCEPLSYQMLFPLLDLSGMQIPPAETIVPAGSLGYTLGSMPCP